MLSEQHATYWKASMSSAFLTHNILLVENLNQFQTCLFMHRFHNRMLQSSFNDYFHQARLCMYLAQQIIIPKELILCNES